jgi:hypothetical protein
LAYKYGISKEKIVTVLTRNPVNPNPLHPNKFLLQFSRLPNVQYFCQTISVPGVALSEAVITNPFVDIYAPGEKAIYDLLNITFIVDEQMIAWKEVHDWIRAMTFPFDYAEYRQLGYLNKMAGIKKDSNMQPQYSDGTLTLLSSSNNPIATFKFYDLFPTTLSSFPISTTDSPDNIITCDATFRYNYFDLVLND